jgi:hypothetical protein
MGPFTLGKQHGENTVKLEDVPDHLRVPKSFNVSQFKRCNKDDTRQQAPPPRIRVTKRRAAEYEIERIIDWKRSTNHGIVCFRVQWKGYPKEESTGEHIHHITRCGGKESWREYTATVNSDALYRLITKVYRPTTYRPRIVSH